VGLLITADFGVTLRYRHHSIEHVHGGGLACGDGDSDVSDGDDGDDEDEDESDYDDDDDGDVLVRQSATNHSQNIYKKRKASDKQSMPVVFMYRRRCGQAARRSGSHAVKNKKVSQP
jgi:hypothetical protein